MANTTIQVVLDEKVAKALRGQSKAEKRTLSNLCAIILEAGLQARQPKVEAA